MAKESMKARERKRERLVARYEKKRAELTKVLKSTEVSEDMQTAKWDAMMQLQKITCKLFQNQNAQSLWINWSSKRVYASIRYLKGNF